MRSAHFLVVAALTFATRAETQSSQSQNCASPAALPPELASWSGRSPGAAAANASAVEKATLTVGRAVDASLHRTTDVAYVNPPERPGGSTTYGGMFTFEVNDAGTYRVGLGAGAWIDVVEDGKPVASTAHGHGPDCSGIRKMVSFSLKRGRHVLQVSGSADATVGILIAKVP